jgi:murein DD-endopeptidase MepM/ murein hydrolase activator NlpD
VALHRSSARRHLPTIATFIALVWLAAACIFSMVGAASAGRSGPEKLVQQALGGRSEPARSETDPRPPTVDVRATEASARAGAPTPAAQPRKPESPKKKEEKREPKRSRKPRRHKKLGHSLPVAPHLVSERDLRAPHHDYPAVDLPLDTGTRVLAITSGRVRATTKWGDCGKGVILRGRDHFTYTYCHGSKLLVGRGRQVSAGQGIMRSGNTGDSTGPHLHLQIRKPNGKLVCPQDLLPKWSEGEPTSPWAAKRVGCKSGVDHQPRKKATKR